jgi:hypothetical protein
MSERRCIMTCIDCGHPKVYGRGYCKRCHGRHWWRERKLHGPKPRVDTRVEYQQAIVRVPVAGWGCRI